MQDTEIQLIEIPLLKMHTIICIGKQQVKIILQVKNQPY